MEVCCVETGCDDRRAAMSRGHDSCTFIHQPHDGAAIHVAVGRHLGRSDEVDETGAGIGNSVGYVLCRCNERENMWIHSVSPKDRSVQLSHCRASVQQRLQNVQQTKNLRHCLAGKIPQNMTNLSISDISLDLLLIQIVLTKQ